MKTVLKWHIFTYTCVVFTHQPNLTPVWWRLWHIFSFAHVLFLPISFKLKHKTLYTPSSTSTMGGDVNCSVSHQESNLLSQLDNYIDHFYNSCRYCVARELNYEASNGASIRIKFYCACSVWNCSCSFVRELLLLFLCLLSVFSLCFSWMV